MAEIAEQTQVNTERKGLGFWMRRVPKECAKTQRDMNADAVHDLRVALRRCRSMADGFMEVDPDPAWQAMKKAGRRLFRRLGELRDTHVMMEWVSKLCPEGDVVGQRMLELFAAQEQRLREEALDALERFDKKKWRAWAKWLPERTRRVRLDGPVFEHIALQRWEEAYALHRRALRVRSQVSFHRLRIGLKRFRYTVENFLPRRHAEWGSDLKQLQDMLGEVHDLDVLGPTLRRTGTLFDTAERERWRALIDKERQDRLDAYRRTMAGKGSLWHAWRAGLPDAKQLEAAALAKLTTWASFLDPDFDHSRHVAVLALQLFDGLAKACVPGSFGEANARRILHAAALLHDVGRSQGKRGHHKASCRLIRAISPPLGWTTEELEMAALVARYHRGPTPREQHSGFGALSPESRERLIALAGVLRLANAFDAEREAAVRRLEVENTGEAIVVRALGYAEEEPLASVLAAERHLLERACQRPVIVKPRTPPPSVDTRLPSPS